MKKKVLSVENISKNYTSDNFRFESSNSPALKNISFNICEREILGVVGETGSGKSTLAKCLCGLIPFDEGKISFIDKSALIPSVQLVFQNADQALNPYQKISTSIAEILKVVQGLDTSKIEQETNNLLDIVGLSSKILNRKPAQLSGGERQRVLIAKALAARPRVLVADEPTSNLDAANRKNILDLFKEIKNRLDMSIVLISHDIQSVKQYADKIIILYNNEIIEFLDAQNLSFYATHPYTKKLLGIKIKEKEVLNDFVPF